jgi:hypothetical protein
MLGLQSLREWTLLAARRYSTRLTAWMLYQGCTAGRFYISDSSATFLRCKAVPNPDLDTHLDEPRSMRPLKSGRHHIEGGGILMRQMIKTNNIPKTRLCYKQNHIFLKPKASAQLVGRGLHGLKCASRCFAMKILHNCFCFTQRFAIPETFWKCSKPIWLCRYSYCYAVF